MENSEFKKYRDQIVAILDEAAVKDIKASRLCVSALNEHTCADEYCYALRVVRKANCEEDAAEFMAAPNDVCMLQRLWRY